MNTTLDQFTMAYGVSSTTPLCRFIDRILEQTPQHARMLKNVTSNSWESRFGFLPQPFLLEAMAQAAGLQDEFLQGIHPPQTLVLGSILTSEFHFNPEAGEQVLLTVTPQRIGEVRRQYAVRAEVDGRLAARAQIILLKGLLDHAAGQ